VQSGAFERRANHGEKKLKRCGDEMFFLAIENGLYPKQLSRKLVFYTAISNLKWYEPRFGDGWAVYQFSSHIQEQNFGWITPLKKQSLSSQNSASLNLGHGYVSVLKGWNIFGLSHKVHLQK